MHFFKITLGLFFLNFFHLDYAAGLDNSAQSPGCNDINHPLRVTARHIEPQGIGYNEGYTTVELFLPFYNQKDHWIPFLDVRGHIFNNGKPAINAGLGARYLTRHRIWGFNGYYDYRNTNHQHYNQVCMGFESLGKIWDFRLNTYLPVGKKQSSPYNGQFNYFEGNNLILNQKYEYALAGINAETGSHLNCWKKVPIYFALGPYYLKGKGSATWGGQIRASIRIFDYLKIEANASYDHLFKWIAQGQIGLSFSFGSKKKILKQTNSICADSLILAQRSYQPVDRFEIIPVDRKYKKAPAINPETGKPYQFIFVNNMSASLGTYESPYHSLISAQTNSSPYDIIYVFPGDRTTRNMDHGIVLQPNQKLWGAATPQTLATTAGLISVPPTDVFAPEITNIDLLQPGTTLSTNNQISGITFTATSGQAILGQDPITVDISSCTFSECGQGDLGIFPVLLKASSPFTTTIENNNFIDNPNGGVFIKLFPGASYTAITMNNNQGSNNLIQSGGASLLNIQARGSSVGKCSVNMMNNIYTNNESGAVNITDFDSPHDGAFTSFKGNFSGNTFSGNGQGITFGTNAANLKLTIKNNDLSNNEAGGILVIAGDSGTQMIKNSSIIIDSNQINNCPATGDGINISPAGENISIVITNNSINNNGGSGFVSFFDQPGPEASIFIFNNTITNNLNLNSNASGGISFDEFSSVEAIIKNNTFDNNAQGNSIGGNGGNGGSVIPDTSSISFIDNQLSGNDTFTFKFFGSSPSTGCLTILGNTSTTDPTYTFEKNSSGSCFIVPCDYESKNTGGFNINLSDVVPSSDCSGNACVSLR